MAASNEEPIRWGIISCGRISSDYCKAIKVTQGAVVVAVAARELDRAQQFAAEHGAERAYDSYEELMKDPAVDIVYIGSIADEHFSIAQKCLAAGKHVVIEKPMTLSYDDSKQLIDMAREKNLFLMEGMWTRCFPAVRKVRDLIQAGTIGRPVAVHGDFGWSTADCGPGHRIWFPKSGGMILDIAMYMGQLGQVAFGSDCKVDNIQAIGTSKNGVDNTTLVNCQYSFAPPQNGNKTAAATEQHVGFLQFYVTGEANTEERVVIQGTKGRIVIEPPAHAPQTIRLHFDQGRESSKEETLDFPLMDDSYTTWNHPRSIGFTYQIAEVNKALRAGLKECPHYTWEDALQIASMIDEIKSQVSK